MGRRHTRGRRLHGILLLDKPTGVSSNRALQQAKRLFDAAKAGHTGSLDPLATGMLPVCFGEATKLAGYLLSADKAYVTRAVLGVRTDSGDADGAVIERQAVPATLDRHELETVCRTFLGEQRQVPPMVSAIKVDGQRLYKLAREGRTVERKARTVHIDALELTAVNLPEIELSIRCSKGTYVRSLVEDIGTALGCGAHVASLHRRHVDPFDGLAMHALTDLESRAANGGMEALDGCLLPIDAGLGHLPQVVLDAAAEAAFCRGQPVRVRTWLVANAESPADVADRIWRIHDVDRRLLGLGRQIDDERVSPIRVMQW